MKFTIGKKLALGFGVVLLLMLLSTFFAYMKAKKIQDEQTSMVTVRMPTVMAIKELQRELNQVQSKGRQVILAGTEKARYDAASQVFVANYEAVYKDLSDLDGLSTQWANRDNKQRLAAIKTEIATLVLAMESGTKQVEAGVKTTTQAGASLQAIIQSAEQLGDMVTHIATAATEQSSATEEVNANIDQIAKITAESSEGAQQSAKACHQLSTLALDLQNAVSQFKIDTNGRRQKSAAPGKTGTGKPRRLQLRAPQEEETREEILV